jgi:hypothetical protein
MPGKAVRKRCVLWAAPAAADGAAAAGQLLTDAGVWGEGVHHGAAVLEHEHAALHAPLVGVGQLDAQAVQGAQAALA